MPIQHFVLIVDSDTFGSNCLKFKKEIRKDFKNHITLELNLKHKFLIPQIHFMAEDYYDKSDWNVGARAAAIVCQFNQWAISFISKLMRNF